MKRQTKFNEEQKQEQESAAQQNESAVEFSGAEEMLRHDAIHTPVPPAIACRLRESIEQEPPRPRSWWQRWFGS